MSTVDFDPFAGGEISRVNPTTGPQREIIASVQMSDEANTAFNEAVSLSIEGAVDAELMENCFHKLIDRHDILSATFTRRGDEICLSDRRNFNWRFEDLGALSAEAQEQEIENLCKNIAISPMNLEEGPLFHAWLLKLSESRYQLIIAVHHVICDGWSFGIMLNELADLYNNNGDASMLPESDSFFDFAEENDAGQVSNADIDYWLDKFRLSPPSMLDLPLDKMRPATRTFGAARFDYQLNPELVSSLPRAAAGMKASLVNLVMAGYFALLHRLTGNEDIIVGLPVAGQAALERPNQMGHMVQLLPIRIFFDENTFFKDLVSQVKGEVFSASEHANFTFGKLIENLPVDRARVPLISTIFNIDQKMPDLKFAAAIANVQSVPRAAENFEIFLNVMPATDSLIIEATYSTSLFSEATIRSWLQALECLLQEAVESPDTPIKRLPLTRDIPDVASAANQTETSIEHADLISAFRAQVLRTPESVAVESGDISLTYADLDGQSNCIAQELLRQGVEGETIVGICCQRSEKMLASALAVLKIGAAYLPLDPEFPPARLAYMLEDSGAVAVIEDNSAPAAIQEWPIVHVNLESIDLNSPGSASLPVLPDSPLRKSYVIYTSGSTGKPKGVCVQNQAMINLLEGLSTRVGIAPEDRLLAVTTLSFDISVLELFMPLIAGASVVIADKQEVKDGEKLAELMDRHGVSIMQATPATWRLLLASNWSNSALIRPAKIKALCGGEPLPPDLVTELFPLVAELWNMYGPTETTVWSSCKKIRHPGEVITIGVPIANTKLHILTEDLKSLPVSAPGELCIGGKGVSLGYHNRPDLSAERFVDHPQFGRIYRTGDSAMLLPNGEIRHLGRFDDQVKLRGFRLELGEIEAVLGNFAEIEAAAVYLWELSPDDVRLVACCVPSSGETLDTIKVRNQLREHLPQYMIPQHVVEIDELPLTPNGKIDRKALLNRQQELVPAQAPVSSGDAEPMTPLEASIAEIFSEQLGGVKVGLDDDFFQLGGHSLTATWTIHEIERKSDVRIGLGDFFSNPTPRSAAKLVEEQGSEIVARHEPGATKSDLLGTGTGGPGRPQPIDAATPANLSPTQHRMWIVDQLFPEATFHNLPSSFRLRGALDVEILQASFRELIERQPALRTRFVIDGPDVVQLTGAIDEAPALELVDISAESEPVEAVLGWVRQQVATPFDLENEWPYRCRLSRLGEDDHAIFFMAHHIVFDGWSFDIFYRELNAIYQARLCSKQPPLPAHDYEYRDYCHWKREVISGEAGQALVERWRDRISPLPEMLELPRDFIPDPNEDPTKVTGLPIRLEPDEVARLRAACEREGVTLFMLFLAAYAHTLARWSAVDELVIGTPVAGRDVPGCKDLLGLFVGAMPLKIMLHDRGSVEDFLQEVKRVCTEAFGDPDVPIEELVREFKLARHIDRNPIFQVMFAFEDARERTVQLGDIPFERINPGEDSSEADIEFWVLDLASGLIGGFKYRKAYFEPRHMESFRDAFLETVRQMATSLSSPLQDLERPVAADIAHYRELNTTSRTYDGLDFVSLVEQCHLQFGDAVALIGGSERVDYRTMMGRVDALASWLVERHDISPGDIVGLYLSRTVDLQVAMLAVAKTGAAYLPLDPNFPEARLAFMVEDSGARLLVCNTDVPPELGMTQVDLRTDWAEMESAAPAAGFVSRAVAADLAYIIYTSGSTGKPKGVAVGHEAVANFLQSMAETPGIVSGDRLLAVTTLSFDISVLELLLPLTAGATVVVASHEDSGDGHRLMELIGEHDINVMQATPSTWRMLLGLGWEGKDDLKVLCGGEALPPDLAEALLPMVGELWNMYGPTETTIWSACKRIEDVTGLVTVGKPIANTQLYVLNEVLQLQPVGVPGELYIGGAGVAHGYHDRAELTAERFIEHPDFGRIYRSGDRARVMGHGEIQHLGRLDDQIKLRGYRIELGEIEAALASVEGISQAAARIIDVDQGDARLMGYFVLEADSSVTTAAIRNVLRKRLPNYMVPTNLVELDALPLTPNGKVDRKSLLSLEDLSDAMEQKAPLESDDQRAMASIWSDLIGVTHIGPDDNFFQLGGHSLLAIKALKRIAEKFGTELRPRVLIMDNLREVTRCAGPALDEMQSVETGSGNNDADEKNNRPGKKSGLLARLMKKG